jgi:uroporphyrinogen-III synthase
MGCSGLVGDGVSNALKGKRVLVTRAEEQSRELVARLEEKGASALVLPMVSFVSPDDPGPVDEAIRNLRNYDWVFVTSQNAWRALRERCEAIKIAPRDVFAGVRIAAVGPASAETVAKDGAKVAHVASKHLGTALAEELAEQVRGKRVLLPRSDRANPDLVETLNRLGANVTEICAYKTTRPEQTDGAAVAKMTDESDAVLFFSPSAVHHLEEAVGNERFRGLSRRTVFAAIGPITKDALRHAGVERVLLASDTSANAIIGALEEYFAQLQAEAKSEQAGVPVLGAEAKLR